MPSIPSAPVRGFDFEAYGISNPSTPKPGTNLNTEYDRSNNVIAALISYLGVSLATDGTLKAGTVGGTQLAPAAWQTIADGIEAQAQAILDVANAASAAATTAVGNANVTLADAQAQVTAAAVLVAAANAVLTAAQASQTATETAKTTAETAATNAGNSAGAATASKNVAKTSEDLAFRWAEYMAGPVVTLGPGETYPEAIDDGLYSAKWWAVRAQDLYNNAETKYSVYNRFVFTVSGGPETQFSGNDDNANALVFQNTSTPLVDIMLNGVSLRTTDYSIDFTVPSVPVVTLTSPVDDGDQLVIIELLALGDFSVLEGGDFYLGRLVEAFDGVRTDFTVEYQDPDTLLWAATTSSHAMEFQVYLSGEVQVPLTDFTRLGAASIQFTAAPASDAEVYIAWHKAVLLTG